MKLSMPSGLLKPRARRQVAFLLGVALLAANLVECRSNSSAQLISADLSVSSYVQAYTHSRLGDGSDVYFPMLEIYNEDGLRIYHSHEAIGNAAVLRGLPAAMRNMKPEPQSPPLVDILEAVPEFKGQEHKVLDRHQVVVLSADLEDCAECRIQARAMDETRKRLLRQSIAILEIHVSAPPR